MSKEQREKKAITRDDVLEMMSWLKEWEDKAKLGKKLEQSFRCRVIRQCISSLTGIE